MKIDGRTAMSARKSAPKHPLQQHVAVGNLEVEDDVELAVELAKELVERLGLRHRARETVENEPAQRVAAREPVVDEPDHQLVRNEIAPVVDDLELPPELARQLLHLPDHVAGGDVRNPVHRRDPLCLCALPRALRPKDQDVQRKNPS